MKHFPFIGREAQLDLLIQACTSTEPTIVMIQARGGMGKTRLLQEATGRLNSRVATSTAVFVDLADSRCHIPLGLESLISSSLPPEQRQELDSLLAQYTALQGTNASPDTARGVVELGTQAFIKAMNTGKDHKQVLIDTVDLPLSQSVAFRRFVATTLPLISNVTVVFAGRNAAQVGLDRLAAAGQIVDLHLPSLKLPAASLFFDGLELPDLVIESLVYLSEGRPILLGLAAQWVELGIALPDVVYRPVRELAAGQEGEQTAFRARFRSILLDGLRQLRKPDDARLLEMAHFEHRYEPAMAVAMHGIAWSTAAAEFSRLDEMFFVKRLPGDIYVLHDEMRDLVNEHIWPLVDPLESYRRQLDADVVRWYEDTLRQAAIRDSVNSSPEMQVAAIHRSWILEAERWFYIVRKDGSEAGETLINAIRAEYNSGQLDLTGLILEKTQPLWPSLNADNQIDLEILRAEWLRASGRRAAASRSLEATLERHSLSPMASYRVHCLMASLAVEQGRARYALEILQNTSSPYPQSPESLLGKVTEGVVFAALGNQSRASELLEMAATGLLNRGMDDDAAYALDRLAYVESVLGRHDAAIAHANQAVVIRRSKGNESGTASSLATLATIYRDGGKFEKALPIYSEALVQFSDIGDLYGESAVRMERGLCHLLQFEVLKYSDQPAPVDVYTSFLTSAKEDLTAAASLCGRFNLQELPKALHELGHCYWEEGQPGTAQNWWIKSLESAVSAGNLRYVLENEIGRCELDVESGLFEHALTIRSRIEQYFEQTRDSHPLLWSRLLKLEAEALFGLDRHDESLGAYRDAMPELARHGGWGRYRLEYELFTLRRNIDSLPPEEASRWLADLANAWRPMLAGGINVAPEKVRILMAAVEAASID